MYIIISIYNYLYIHSYLSIYIVHLYVYIYVTLLLRLPSGKQQFHRPGSAWTDMAFCWGYYGGLTNNIRAVRMG